MKLTYVCILATLVAFVTAAPTPGLVDTLVYADVDALVDADVDANGQI